MLYWAIYHFLSPSRAILPIIAISTNFYNYNGFLEKINQVNLEKQ